MRMFEVANGKRKSWLALQIALVFVVFLGTCRSLPRPVRSCQTVAAIHMKPHVFLSELKVRGGASNDSDSDEDEESDENELEEIEAEVTSAMSATKKVLIVLAKAAVATSKAAIRAVKAAFQSDDVEGDEEEELPSMVTRVVRTVKRMWVAAFSPSQAEDESSVDLATTVKKKSEMRKKSTTASEEVEVSIKDFGSYLEESYSLSVDRGDEPTTVMGGTIGDALRESRSKSRLLVVFIPSARPGRGRKKTPDHEAIMSLLSPEVSEIAEKQATKKVDSGSFVLWSAKASSPEAITAIKRLKAKQSSSKGEKRPVLVVAYPAQVSVTVNFRCWSRYVASLI